jgi:hypothetical protein
MTVTAICQRRTCKNHAEAAQEYCSRCLSLWPRLSNPIDIPLSEE